MTLLDEERRPAHHPSGVAILDQKTIATVPSHKRRYHEARNRWFRTPYALRSADDLPADLSVCRNCGPMLMCPSHGCPWCWIVDTPRVCDECMRRMIVDYPDHECLICEDCKACQCHVPVCRLCERCRNHVDEATMPEAELLDAWRDYLLCEHSWYDPVTARWT